MSPATVAPGDSTLFTVLVPNEGDSPTVQVDLQIPDGVIPFSFEETPGWTREEQLAPDQSIDVVSWKGSLPPGEFVRFALLASTPEQEGEISWPAVQRYANGEVVRWIGPADSEEPAAVTTVAKSAATQDAGGESASGDAGATETAPATEPGTDGTTAGETVAAPEPSASGGGTDIIAYVAIGGGVLLGIFGLWTVSNSRRKKKAGP